MTPEAVQAPEPTPAAMGEFSRITGVLFEPTKTFEDVARRPKFLVPLVLTLLSALLVTFLFTQHVGWDRFMRQQMENSSRMQQVPAEQREQMLATQTKFGPIFATVGIIVGIPIYYLVASAVLLGIVAGIMSAPVKFKQVFAVMCYANMVGILSAGLTIAVMFLKNPDQFNLQNPLAFNPGAFMDPTSTSKFLYSLASSLDLFVIWTIILIAIGLKAAGGKKLSFGGALFCVVLPWAIWVLGKSSLAGMFS
jgi:hypothetical protein